LPLIINVSYTFGGDKLTESSLLSLTTLSSISSFFSGPHKSREQEPANSLLRKRSWI